MTLKAIIFAMLMVVSSLVHADVLCADTGEAPSQFDQSVVPRIIRWVSHVEKQFKLQPPASEDDAMRLQAVIVKWENQVPRESVDWFFRAAVGHGVSVQYEMFMLKADPKDAKKHRFFIDLEAARADACLAMVRDQMAPSY